MQEKSINLIDIIDYYYRNFLRLLILAIIPSAIGISLILYIHPFKPQQDIFSTNILIQDPNVLNNISNSYFFSERNLSEAISRSNLEINIDRKFIDALDIISGHSDINEFVEHYIKQDFSSLVKDLKFKPEELDKFLENIINEGSRFLVLVIKLNNSNLDKFEVQLFASNLIDVINENYSKDFNSTTINLKKINDIIIQSPVSILDVNNISSRLGLIRNYIRQLNDEYISFAPSINLDVVLNKLNNSNDLFNYVVQQDNTYKNFIIQKTELEIKAVEEKINSITSQLEFLGYSQPENSNNQVIASNNSASVSYDSTFLDTILNLGTQAASVDQRNTMMNIATLLKDEKIDLVKQLRRFDVNFELEITQEEAFSYLVKMINETTIDINNYIDTVKETKKFQEPIKQLSIVEPESNSIISAIIMPSIYIVFASLIFSFGFISFGIFREFR